MVVSLNKGTQMQTPKYNNPSYGDPQNGGPDLGFRAHVGLRFRFQCSSLSGKGIPGSTYLTFFW